LSIAALEMSSLSLFYQEMRAFPRLKREEEYRLARQWHDHGDREAAKRLVCSNLRVVAGIARQYRHYGLPEMDLIQEGTIGLMHAVKRFDPERGFRLATYASWWIRASIQDFILRSWSIVKLGTNKLQRKVFAGLKQAKNSIAALEGRQADEVGAEYGLTGIEYQQAATAFLQRDVSLDAGEDARALVETLPSPEASPEEIVAESNWQDHRSRALQQAMASLPERDRHIVEQRHLTDTPSTLKELAVQLGVSIERVRQLESRAMKRLREAMV